MSDELDTRLEARAGQILQLLSEPTWRPSRWSLRNPEVRKSLDRLFTAIRDTERLRRAGSLRPEHEQALESLLLAPADLRTLSADALGLLLENVDQVLVDAGDERFVEAMLEIEYARDAYEGGGPIPTWSTIHGEERPTDLDDAKRRLALLLRARHSLYTLRRARETAKALRLLWLSPVLAALVVAFIALADWVADDASWREGLLVAVAGALGATLAAAFRLRDALPRLGDLRTFWYAFALQIPLGAAAGLVLWIVLESGVVDVAGGEGWAVPAVLAFVAGFSEPFLLKTVERIAGDGQEDEDKPAADRPG